MKRKKMATRCTWTECGPVSSKHSCVRFRIHVGFAKLIQEAGEDKKDEDDDKKEDKKEEESEETKKRKREDDIAARSDILVYFYHV